MSATLSTAVRTQTEQLADAIMTYFNPRIDLGGPVSRDLLRQGVERIIQETLDKAYAEGYNEGIDAERFWGHIAGEYNE